MPVHSPVRSCDWPVQNSPLYTRFTHNFPEPQGEDLQDRPPPHIHHQGTARNATGCHKKKKKHRKTKKKKNIIKKSSSIFVNAAQPDISFPLALCFWVVKISSKRQQGNSVKKTLKNPTNTHSTYNTMPERVWFSLNEIHWNKAISFVTNGLLILSSRPT